MRDLFFDLDGVLADFDRAYEAQFGVRLDRNAPGDPPNMWENIRSVSRFYRHLPLMPEARELWTLGTMLHARPTILSGLSEEKCPGGEEDKRAWVVDQFGATVPVIICRSADKCLHGRPGDVLVDDWARYQSKWEDMGGVFVLHTDLKSTVVRLLELFR